MRVQQYADFLLPIDIRVGNASAGVQAYIRTTRRRVFFGHYFKPARSPLVTVRQNVARLDHSSVKDGISLPIRALWRVTPRAPPA